MELLARLVEQRLGARKLDRGSDAFGAHELHLLAHISVGDDQRVLDERLRLLREQPVEAAVERHACNDGYQHRRNRSDNREQGNDAHVKSRRGAPAAPRLHNTPDLARNDHNEQKDRDRVGQEERDHDLMGRRDRREPGQHEEGDQRRQQRERNGREAKRPREPCRRGRRGSGRQLGGGGLTDVSHQVFSSQTGSP